MICTAVDAYMCLAFWAILMSDTRHAPLVI